MEKMGVKKKPKTNPTQNTKTLSTNHGKPTQGNQPKKTLPE